LDVDNVKIQPGRPYSSSNRIANQYQLTPIQRLSAATLVRPNEKVLSISGDGGFLFSAMELETAVRLRSNLVHMILIDGRYDMVAAQELLKYGRPSGTDFGPVDPVRFAEAFGAKGFMAHSPDEISTVLKQAFDTPGPVLVGLHIDNRDNRKLFEQVDERSIH
jgi:acetolactate synthase I/II/III large subunit